MKRRRRGGSRSLSGYGSEPEDDDDDDSRAFFWGDEFPPTFILHCTYKLVYIMLPSWEEWVITRCRKLIAAVRNKN